MIIRLFFILLTFLLFNHSAFAEILSVNGNNVNLRSGPGTDFPVKWEYGTGFPLKVVEKKGEWVKVSDFEKDTGWIHQALLSDTKHVIVNVNKESKKKINIRSEATTKSRVVGQAFYGVVFEVLGVKAGWARVRHESGLEGWIKLTLLWGE